MSKAESARRARRLSEAVAWPARFQQVSAAPSRAARASVSRQRRILIRLLLRFFHHLGNEQCVLGGWFNLINDSLEINMT